MSLRKQKIWRRMQMYWAAGAVSLSSLMSVAIFGCALAHAPQRDEIVEQALPTDTRIPPGWSAASAASGQTCGVWLESFNDPALNAIVAEAIKNNLDLRQAADRVDIASANVMRVGADLLPQVSGQFGVAGLVHGGSEPGGEDNHRLTRLSKGLKLGSALESGTNSPINALSSVTDAALQHRNKEGNQGQDSGVYWSNSELGLISWELDLWGQLRSQQAAAKADYEATALDYYFAQQSLATTVAKSWYQASAAYQLVELHQQDVHAYEELLKLTVIRQTAGRVADLEVAEVTASLKESQTQLGQAMAAYTEAKRSLEVLLGRYPAGAIEVSQAFVPVPGPIPTGVPGELLERRPDIVAAEQRVLAAFRVEQSAKLAFLPSITFNLQGGRLSDNTLSLLNINPYMLHGDIGMHVPIYEGGKLQANLKIATAEQKEAIAGYGSIALRAFREVENALTNEGILIQMLEYTQAAVVQRVEAVRIARDKYEAGSLDMLAVLQLQNYQFETQEQLVGLRNTQLANRINLLLALGGDFETKPAPE